MVNNFIRRKVKSSVWLGFIFSTIFIFFLVAAPITDSITDGITNRFIDDLKKQCGVTFADLPINLERCLVKTEEARDFETLNVETCSKCGEEGLCLKDLDLQFCEEALIKNKSLIDLRTTPKNFTNKISSLEMNTILMWIVGLFAAGWLYGKYVVKLR